MRTLFDGPVQYHLGEFPPKEIDWARLVPLIGRANAALARYDGLVAGIPNASVLLSPLTTQEAVLSSRIEGTNVTMSEVLEIEAGASGEGVTQPKRDEAEEIINYRSALTFAANYLQHRKLSSRLLREAHALLMKGVRGHDKDPGAFRREQNWIGPRGCSLEEAHFVPIPQVHLDSGLDAWDRYVQSPSEPDPLVQLAIIHVEFEALHPFKDGNGRLGRIIVPLFLFERRILSGPNFYMSGYLEARREEYVQHMQAVSRDGAWTEWAAFFLQGLIEQAKENQEKARAILDLYQQMHREIPRITRSPQAARAVEFLFLRPIFGAAQFTAESGIPSSTVPRILRSLRDAGIVRVLREAAGQRPAVYVFPALVNIAEGRTVF